MYKARGVHTSSYKVSALEVWAFICIVIIIF